MKIYRNLVDAVEKALKEIFEENRHADKVIERTLRQNPRWGARDRRFIAETTYDMVRWWRLLHEVSGLPFEGALFDKEIFWQLFGAWLLINGNEVPEAEELKDLSPADVQENYKTVQSLRKVRESIPDWLDELAIAELGEEIWEKEIHSLNEEAKVVLRANTLKISLPDLKNRLIAAEIETEESEFSPDCLILKKRQNIFHLDEFKEGFFELQDASSQLVAPFLEAKPGMRVIDACAGGGGKTLHLASLMKNKGKIIAMDTELWKLEELQRRARRAGAFNIEVKLIESNKVIKRLHNSADCLLLDVPCSGLGVLKRNPDAKWKLSLDFIERVKKQQAEILQNYSSMLKAGGILVYSTCSIFPSENEKQIEQFLNNQQGKFELIKEKKILPSMGFDGFYMAALKKSISIGL